MLWRGLQRLLLRQSGQEGRKLVLGGVEVASGSGSKSWGSLWRVQRLLLLRLHLLLLGPLVLLWILLLLLLRLLACGLLLALAIRWGQRLQ